MLWWEPDLLLTLFDSLCFDSSLEGFKPAHHHQGKMPALVDCFFYELGFRSNSGLLPMEVGSKSNHIHDVRTDVGKLNNKLFILFPRVGRGLKLLRGRSVEVRLVHSWVLLAITMS